MRFIYDDGGRSKAGYRGTAGDCVTRAVAIATEQPYQQVYEAMAEGNLNQRRSKYTRASHQSRTARGGINTNRKWFKDYMIGLGWKWTPTMQIGSGCHVHLREDELPSGRLVVALSNHYAAVVDSVVHDLSDPSRGGTRCVYGYWIKSPAAGVVLSPEQEPIGN